MERYGVYREYSHGKPTITSDRHYNLSDVSDSPYLSLNSSAAEPQASNSLFGLSLQKVCQTVNVLEPFFAPFRNPTIYRLIDWFYNCTFTKSLQDLNMLVKNILLASDFKREDLMGFSAQKENELMDAVCTSRIYLWLRAVALHGKTSPPIAFFDGKMKEIPIESNSFGT